MFFKTLRHNDKELDKINEKKSTVVYIAHPVKPPLDQYWQQLLENYEARLGDAMQDPQILIGNCCCDNRGFEKISHTLIYLNIEGCDRNHITRGIEGGHIYRGSEGLDILITENGKLGPEYPTIWPIDTTFNVFKTKIYVGESAYQALEKLGLAEEKIEKIRETVKKKQ